MLELSNEVYWSCDECSFIGDMKACDKDGLGRGTWLSKGLGFEFGKDGGPALWRNGMCEAVLPTLIACR